MWNKASLFALFAMAGRAVHLTSWPITDDPDACIIGTGTECEDDHGNTYRVFDGLSCSDFTSEVFEHVCIDNKHYEELEEENCLDKRGDNSKWIKDHIKCTDNQGHQYAILTSDWPGAQCPETCKFESVCETGFLSKNQEEKTPWSCRPNDQRQVWCQLDAQETSNTDRRFLISSDIGCKCFDEFTEIGLKQDKGHVCADIKCFDGDIDVDERAGDDKCLFKDPMCTDVIGQQYLAEDCMDGRKDGDDRGEIIYCTDEARIDDGTLFGKWGGDRWFDHNPRTDCCRCPDTRADRPCPHLLVDKVSGAYVDPPATVANCDAPTDYWFHILKDDMNCPTLCFDWELDKLVYVDGSENCHQCLDSKGREYNSTRTCPDDDPDGPDPLPPTNKPCDPSEQSCCVYNATHGFEHTPCRKCCNQVKCAWYEPEDPEYEHCPLVGCCSSTPDDQSAIWNPAQEGPCECQKGCVHEREFCPQPTCNNICPKCYRDIGWLGGVAYDDDEEYCVTCEQQKCTWCPDDDFFVSSGYYRADGKCCSLHDCSAAVIANDQAAKDMFCCPEDGYHDDADGQGTDFCKKDKPGYAVGDALVPVGHECPQ